MSTVRAGHEITLADTPLKRRFGLLKNTGDKIAGATGFLLSGAASSCISVALTAMATPLKRRFGLLKNTGDEIAGATD
jgi:hypothetical protein